MILVSNVAASFHIMSALLETFLPHRDPTAETTAELAAPFGHCPTYTKIIKSRLSSRSVQNLWIKKNFDFSRIFIGLTLKPCYTSKYEYCFSSNDLTQYFRYFIAEKVWKECWSTECLANSTEEHCKLTRYVRWFQKFLLGCAVYKEIFLQNAEGRNDLVAIVPNPGINLRKIFSEKVIDDDLWFELFMIVKI